MSSVYAVRHLRALFMATDALGHACVQLIRCAIEFCEKYQLISEVFRPPCLLGCPVRLCHFPAGCSPLLELAGNEFEKCRAVKRGKSSGARGGRES